MASENIEDWDRELTPTPSMENEEEEEEVDSDDARQKEIIKKLQKYVDNMAYRPVPSVLAKPRTEELAQPKKDVLKDNWAEFGDIVAPKQRGKRMKRMLGKYTAITTEQMEEIIRADKVKQKKKEKLLSQREHIYYEMLTKLENQSRVQYLNMLKNKFANFIAKLATTMRIPPTLVEPYARMQRSLFCNILKVLDIRPTNANAMYYNTQEACEYEVCHKLAHALLSLIIKSLDASATMNPDDLKTEAAPVEDLEMDNYIKARIMCAAQKKIKKYQCKKRAPMRPSFKVCKWNGIPDNSCCRNTNK